MAKVKIEGNTLDLDDSICKSDKSLKAALLPYYPAVANAEISRKTEGDTMTVTVTKKAGSKGLDAVVDALNDAPETISPILLLEASGWKRAKRSEVDEALLLMLEDESRIERLTKTLEQTPAESAAAIPTGF